MKRTRRRYDREFKISIVAELEGGKPLLRLPRAWHPPVFHPGGELNWLKILKRAFSGNSKMYKYEARFQWSHLAGRLPKWPECRCSRWNEGLEVLNVSCA